MWRGSDRVVEEEKMDLQLTFINNNFFDYVAMLQGFLIMLGSSCLHVTKIESLVSVRMP